MDSRDDGARRKVADAVKAVAVEGAERAAADAYAGRGWLKAKCAEVGVAASAVVLASDLRAPANGLEPTTIVHDEASALTEEDWQRMGQVFEYDKYGNSRPVNESPFRVPSGGGVECAEAQMGRAPCGVSPNRQGWRARLANVERLLAEGMEDAGTSSLPYHRMRDALAEVRAMIDGAE